MFLFRSAFWLLVAFMVIKPGVDLNAAAGSISAQAMTRGQQLITQQIEATQCTSLQCAGGRAVLAAALTPSPQVGTPMQASSTMVQVPLPRRRPGLAG
ncbi:hypothetical protein PSQ90_02830 [Devosia rhodophyticola]|uniref:DUF2946 domain-containing protein n=1 Tax=Devosia rhodophyticola TaxID=3026423 RepID=A0ABY7YYU4_9HYPH|nr:hypothetical protein [Devosia rhodophyticola]WDR06421.1 hypothetical protein PSQ90_02830 [Devosia rhodophyticola]